MSDQPCPTCGGTTGFVNRRGTLDVCDDPWHDARDQHDASLDASLDAEKVRYMMERAIEHRDAGYDNAENEVTIALCVHYFRTTRSPK